MIALDLGIDVDADTTRVMLQLEFDPQGFGENAGNALGLVRHRAEGDLERFRDFIETRGTETGAWRDNVPRLAPTTRGSS